VARNAAPATGFAKFLAVAFGKEVAGYAALLIFSLATITGSMYVLSSRESALAIRATRVFEGNQFGIENSADFRPESGVRTVIVQFQGGVVSNVRDAITNLAGAIRAVSSNIIDEARREDAARPSAFGLSADTALAAQAPALNAAAVGALAGGQQPTVSAAAPTAPTAPAAPTPGAAAVQPIVPPAAATASPAPPPAPTTAPAVIQPTLASTTQPSAASTQVPPTATPLPTATSAPSDPGVSQPQQTSGPSNPSQPAATGVPAAIEPVATQAAAVVAPVLATTVPVVTAVPIATLVPLVLATQTPAPIGMTFGAGGGLAGCPNCVAAVFTGNGAMGVGDTQYREVTMTNGGVTWFELHFYSDCGSCGAGNPLWEDAVNGLQVKLIAVSGTRITGGTVLHQGPIRIAEPQKILLNSFNPGDTLNLRIELSLPNNVNPTISNQRQGWFAPVTFLFALAN